MAAVTNTIRCARTRLFWWRYHLTRVLTPQRHGIRRHRWALPLAYTRSLQAGDNGAAIGVDQSQGLPTRRHVQAAGRTAGHLLRRLSGASQCRSSAHSER
ncbi:hypothetical protein GCM10027262_14420 [Nocardia tengchongensis]